MDDFRKYEQLWQQGWEPTEVYLAGKADGLDAITLIRMIRKVASLSLRQAKEVTIVADGVAPSLDAFQESLVPVVEKLMEMRPGDYNPSSDDVPVAAIPPRK